MPMTEALLKKALEAHRAGDILNAKKGYHEVLEIDPNQADAMALLGVLLSSAGQKKEALEHIQKATALDPKAALFQVYLGNLHMEMGNKSDAIDALTKASQLDPSKADISYDLGNALRESDRLDEAKDAYLKAITLQPNHALARNNLALVYEKQDNRPKAIEQLEQLTLDVPDYCEGWLNLCSLTEKEGDYERAVEAGQKAHALEPQNPKCWFGIGVAYGRMDKHVEAIPYYQQALRLKPEWPEVWDNFGQSLQQLNDLKNAEEAFKNCIAAAGQAIDGDETREVDESEYGNRYWHLALLQLLKGDYINGFAHYRSRFKELDGLFRETWPRPIWKGEDIKGKTLLVMAEQGAGDFLMMMRYIPELKANGTKVILYTSKHLAPLFENWEAIDTLIIKGNTIPDFDYYALLFDLPYCFKTTIYNVPNNVPYLPTLGVDENTLLEGNGKPKVGIVWGGAPLHKHDYKRSLPLSTVMPLFDNKDVQFFSLNLDKRDGDDELLATTDVVDLAPRLKNFADTARFMSQMDLIISCDTSTAHMAGGLGKKTWTLITYAPDWRWLLGREDSPWYPTMKLFRQKTAGDWPEVIERVKAALQEL